MAKADQDICLLTLIASNYQVQMMRCLREVNVDDNSVGWYQSTNMGNFMNQSLIEHQFEFQQALSKSVLIIHGKSLIRIPCFKTGHRSIGHFKSY